MLDMEKQIRIYTDILEEQLKDIKYPLHVKTDFHLDNYVRFCEMHFMLTCGYVFSIDLEYVKGFDKSQSLQLSFRIIKEQNEKNEDIILLEDTNMLRFIKEDSNRSLEMYAIYCDVLSCIEKAFSKHSVFRLYKLSNDTFFLNDIRLCGRERIIQKTIQKG